MRSWVVYLVAGVVLEAVYVLVPNPELRAALIPAGDAVAAIAVLVALGRGRARNRPVWWLIALALLNAAIAHVFLGSGDVGNVVLTIFLGAHLLAAAGSVSLSRRAGWGTAVEAVIITMPLLMIVWLLDVVPVLRSGGDTPVSLSSPILSVIIVFGVMRALISLEMRVVPARMLLAGLTCWTAADVIFAGSRSATPTVFIMCLWMTNTVLLASAALHPRMHEINIPRRSGLKLLTANRHGFLGASITALNVVGAIATRGPSQAIFVGGFVCCLLMSFRVQELVRDMTRSATRDPLTGLPNRSELMRQLSFAIAALPADGSGTLALLFCDLDRFKDVNDSLGHEVGDQLLVTIAGRMSAYVRAGDVVARLGGDEFVILFPRATEATARQVAERLATVFAEPLRLADAEFFPSVSVGIRLTSDPTAEPGALMRDADAAMYHAKSQGRGRAELFDGRFTDEALDRLRLDTDLRQAIGLGQLTCFFQPEVDIVTGRLYALEALVRWNHPERGLLPPDTFIPYAETHGLIGAIFDIVLGQSLDAQERWFQRFGWRPVVAVNLAPAQAADRDLPPGVLAALSAHETPASALILEVTETALADKDAMDATLSELRRHGVVVAVDDFGTGYSSVARLAARNCDSLKIDRSFTTGIAGDEARADVVRAMIAMAHALGMYAVAEGVEDAETLEKLRELRCDAAQGYYFARPADERTVGEMIAATPAWHLTPAI